MDMFICMHMCIAHNLLCRSMLARESRKEWALAVPCLEALIAFFGNTQNASAVRRCHTLLWLILLCVCVSDVCIVHVLVFLFVSSCVATGQ